VKIFFSYYFMVFVVSFLIAYFITPVIKKMALRLGIIDKPALRKIHKEPMALLGGVAIFIGFLVAVLPFVYKADKSFIGILIGGGMILVLGIIDDVLHLGPRIKLVGQIMVALLVCLFGVSIDFVTNPFGGMIQLDWYLAFPLTILWIVAIINTINLIDGIDGLAAGIVAISALFISIVAINTGQYLPAILTLALFGATLGFLKHNFFPAQIFMGDSGSMFLGYILATVSIVGVLKATITISLAVPILVLGIPITDTLFAIFRRIKNGKEIFKADNDHFHHRLLRKGFSQKQVGVLCYIITILLGLVAFFISR
jgi:UDP-GlcNAc:undecaprenyl-phosphate/decaprenyl-phosphate GlcNAc-1-phosphate transferase